MVFERELTELRARKALLQVECRLQRGLCEVEFAQLRGRFNFLRRGGDWLQRCKPYLALLAPVAGFILVRRWRVIARWGGRALVWKIIRGVTRRA